MKKRILSVALLVSAWGGYSQVGIGTLTPDKSSQLDVTANNKGILIPRVSLTSTTDTTTITNGNVNSLLVFNTATQNDITPGYYYWYIDKWKRMVNDDEVGGNVYYDGDTFTYVDANGETQIVNVKKLVQDNESQTVIITVDDQQYYVSEAYLAANDGAVPTSIDPDAVPAGIYPIDVVGGVVNNFEEIVNHGPVIINGDEYETIEQYIQEVVNVEGSVRIIYDGDDNIIFQEWDESTNTWVTIEDNTFERIVQANESQTLLAQNSEEDQQYYISELYLQSNEAPTQADIDGWGDTPPAGVYAIAFVDGIVNNIEEIVNHGPVIINGDEYETIEQYIQEVVNVEGSVRIIYDGDDNIIFQEWDESTNTWVTIEDNTFERIVQANESQTLLAQNSEEDQQYYISELYLQSNEAPTQADIDGWGDTPPAGVYAIAFVDGIVNNIEEIVNHGHVIINGDEYETIEQYIQEIVNVDGSVRINIDETTNQVTFQEWDVVNEEWVTINNNQFEDIVQANESQTLLAQNSEEDQQYYISELYLQSNEAPTQADIDGWGDTPPAGVYAIAFVDGIVNNIEEIVNHGPVIINGDEYETIEQYIQEIVNVEGSVRIIYDGDDNITFQEWDESTNTWVTIEDNTFERIVHANESQTLLAQNSEEDQQYYISELYLQDNDAPTQADIDGWGDTPPAGVYTIAFVDGVVNNIEEIVNHGPVIINGDEYETIEQYIQEIVNVEGSVRIIYDGDDNIIFQEWDESTNTWVTIEDNTF